LGDVTSGIREADEEDDDDDDDEMEGIVEQRGAKQTHH